MKKYNEFSDERGKFKELFKSSDFFDAKQVSINIVNPCKKKGGHFHKITTEVFVIIEGEMKVYLEYSDDTREQLLLSDSSNNTVSIKPFTKHFIESSKGCKFLIFTNKEFDPENPDTYTGDIP